MEQAIILLTKRDKEQIQTLAGIGLSLDKIALILDVSESCIDSWVENLEVNRLYRRGCAIAEVVVAKGLFQKAKSGDIAAISWWEKSRAGRSDKSIENNTHTSDEVVIYLPDNNRNDFENVNN